MTKKSLEATEEGIIQDWTIVLLYEDYVDTHL